MTKRENVKVRSHLRYFGSPFLPTQAAHRSYPSHTKASNTQVDSKPMRLYSAIARSLALVTVSEMKWNPRPRRFFVDAASRASPRPAERYSGSTQTWVMWPTSRRTCEQRMRPISLRVGRARTTKDAWGSKVPHPGKRTMLLRKRSEPVRVRY